MRVIHKVALDLLDPKVPADARLLSVQMQSGRPCVWFTTHADGLKETRSLRICGTGHAEPPDDTWYYVGTVIDGLMVWHVYDLHWVTRESEDSTR